MAALENVRLYVQYHVALLRQVWDQVDLLTEEQFTQEDAYSHGSIQHLMVHITSVDRRWLAGLKDLPDVGQLKTDDYPNKASARAIFEQVATDLLVYVDSLSEDGMLQNAANIPNPRMIVLMHIVNHGTDHRATVLQKLNQFGVPSFGQDFILWLWNRK